MKTTLQGPLALLLSILFSSVMLAGYEKFNGGPIYTCKDFDGNRRMLGADKRTSFLVRDEQGNPVEIIAGWDFPDAPEGSSIVVRDSKGEYHFKQTYLPNWLIISQAVLSPFLILGHLTIDGPLSLILGG